MASETWVDEQFDILEAAYGEVPIEAKARIAELESTVLRMYREHPIAQFEQWIEDLGLNEADAWKPRMLEDVLRETTLLPCPMCGAAQPSVQTRWIGFTHTHNGAFSAGYRGECCECGLTTRAFSDEADAARAWNTRYHCGLTDDWVSLREPCKKWTEG